MQLSVYCVVCKECVYIYSNSKAEKIPAGMMTVYTNFSVEELTEEKLVSRVSLYTLRCGFCFVVSFTMMNELFSFNVLSHFLVNFVVFLTAINGSALMF